MAACFLCHSSCLVCDLRVCPPFLENLSFEMTSRYSFIRAVTPSWSLPEVFAQRETAQNAAYQQVKTEEDFQLRSSEDEEDPQPPTRRHSLLGAAQQLLAQCSPRLILATIGLLAFLLHVSHLLPSRRYEALSIEGQADHKLYLMIPSSNKPDIGFCRTELTAAILGYPTPFILNQNDHSGNEAVQQREKIRFIEDHLNGMGHDRDDDLVILLGNARSWFQLRSEVLIERYYRINEQANRRLQKQAGEEGAPEQRVVFAAQNSCPGQTLDEVSCFASPSIPLDKANTLRFLSDSLAIGPVKDMRKIFNRANGKATIRKGEKITQEGLLAELFGEQEFRREFLRQGSWSSSERKLDSVLKSLGHSGASSITEAVPGRKLLEHPENVDYEMAIGLDYGNELGVSIAHHADREGVDWIRHNPKFQKSRALPQDIKASMPPFWSTKATDLPIDKTWADVPLLTSKRTNAIPAIINVGGEELATNKGGLDWRTLWLHHDARKLWQVQKEVSRLPLMSIVDGNGTQHTFWNQELRMDRDGANWRDGGWRPWSDHCSWSRAGQVVLNG